VNRDVVSSGIDRFFIFFDSAQQRAENRILSSIRIITSKDIRTLLAPVTIRFCTFFVSAV
jgi:hypothetical protein